MRTYFDTSAFVKRYILEQGDEEVEYMLNQSSELALSVLSLPEMFSAITRLKNENKLSLSFYSMIKDRIYTDLTDIILFPVTPEVITLTTDIIEKNQVKTLDAIHIASAREWACDCFVSADKTQINTAKKVGLPIVHIGSSH